MFRVFAKPSKAILKCTPQHKITDSKVILYQMAIYEPYPTLPEAINKGFAFLTFIDSGHRTMCDEARVAFDLARTLDVHRKYTREIACGWSQLTDINIQCYHAISTWRTVNSMEWDQPIDIDWDAIRAKELLYTKRCNQCPRKSHPPGSGAVQMRIASSSVS